VTPQSNFMVAAPITPGREVDLRRLLLTMNGLPGMAKPDNPLVPFGTFDTLHFARFVILNDTTLDDLKVFGPQAEFKDAPIYLAFLGDCDGPGTALLADFTARAGDGLRKIFAYCEGFDENGDLLQWMQSHSLKPAANYVNWIGRTVRRIHEDEALHKALAKYLDEYLSDRSVSDEGKENPKQIHRALIRAVNEKGPQLTDEAPTPLDWQMRRLLTVFAAAFALYLGALPVVKLNFAAALFVYGTVLLLIGAVLALFLVHLRWHETTDPDVQEPPIPPSNEHLLALGQLQDHDVTNQYTAFGSFKPGPFSRWTTMVIWWLVNLATPILYPRGTLARIKTIHFARWVYFDGKRRGLFASNYDGSSESYMDDFVNKVAFGLNLTFGQGVGYPQTHFLLWGGAKREQEFKNVQRRHALPTEVWYKAYPGLTLIDIERNARIREGLKPKRRIWELLKPKRMSEAETIRRWLAEI
jgi:hypothetical protein